MRDTMRKYAEALVIAGVVGLLCAIYAAVYFAFEAMPLRDYVRVLLSFLCFGLLIGTIFAFDAESELKLADRPGIRCLVGCLCGAVIGAVWDGPLEATALAIIVGAILGLLGMSWAGFVDLN
jgi:uncharacterized membrane protein